MLDTLRRPISPPVLAAGVLAAAIFIALYCVGYSRLSGHQETLPESLGWAVVNICPWLVALEFAKRAPRWMEASAILVGAGLVSLLLGLALGIGGSNLEFEAWRRVPPLLAVAALVALLRSGLAARAESAEIPLLPRQIDWVRAAGNYVELRAAERTVVHRSPIGSIERELASHGFVRIHRSTLVRRDRIARVRTEDVVLHDGTHLKIGKRYRAALAH
jgi:LytTr DNA-binding domain